LSVVLVASTQPFSFSAFQLFSFSVLQRPPLMGTLRLFLALVVIAAHTLTPGQVPWITGNLAVRLFFLVSGFYMALILSGKYQTSTAGGLSLFYSNRALRIFPLLGLTLAFDLGLMALFTTLGWTWSAWPALLAKLWHDGNEITVFLLSFTQLSGFGVDFVHLFNFTSESQVSLYAGPPSEAGFRAWKALPMSHTWSISCELVFYLFAPWLVRFRLRSLIGISLVSWSLAPLLAKGFGLQPLANVASSFFAPFQVSYFLMGILSYRLFQHTRLNPTLLPRASQFILLSLFASLCLAYTLWNSLSYTLTQVLLFCSAVTVIPILFKNTARSSWDRQLGELSYPAYLTHISVIRLMDAPPVIDWLGTSFKGSFAHAATVAIITLTVSWLLSRTIDKRIDSFRQSRVPNPRTPARPLP
jgi:peptidoglycan/LPS O-acetylase OafA/YrhL